MYNFKRNFFMNYTYRNTTQLLIIYNNNNNNHIILITIYLMNQIYIVYYMYIYSRKNITQLIINKNQKHNISINQINFD